MGYFCKRPVVVEAVVLEEDRVIETLEGPLQGRKGDYLITGIKGEQYPCKPDIFHATYYEVTKDVYDEFMRKQETLSQVNTINNGNA